MSDVGSILQQVGTAAGAVANAMRGLSYPPGSYPVGSFPPGAYPGGGYPSGSFPAGGYQIGNAGFGTPVVVQPGAIPADQVSFSQPVGSTATPSGPPAQSGGLAAALASLWQGIVNFFRALLGGSTAVASSSSGLSSASVGFASKATAWPASNADARQQLFEMFPAGSGVALGFYPVSVQKSPSAIVASVPAFGQFAAFWQNGQLYYQDNNAAPQPVSSVTSVRGYDGSTLFSITTKNGKVIQATIGRDGHNLSCQGFSVRIG